MDLDDLRRVQEVSDVMLGFNPKFPRDSAKARLARHLIAISMMFIGPGPFVLAQQKVGYVLEAEGKWTIGGTTESLNTGKSVAGGTFPTNSHPADGDHIVVANLRGEVIKTIRCKTGVCRECRESGACYDPVHPLPNIPESPSTVSTTFNAVLELFASKPDRYSIHRVRGSGLLLERNEVVRLDGSVVDVSGFFEGEEKGSYEFQFVPLSGEGSGKKDLKTTIMSFNWNAREKASLSIEGIHPGLYEMWITRGDGTSFAWVLLCSPASYPSSAGSFQGFRHQTDGWGASVTQATKLAYQRAYLELLVSSSSGSVQ